MDYKIIATLGPSSAESGVWENMLAAGVTDFRLNTSHLTAAQVHAWLKRLAPFLTSRPTPPRVVLDMQGSKWRLGKFTPIELAAGSRIELILASSTRRRGVLPVPHPDFFKAASLSSGEIALNDAKVLLKVDRASQVSMTASVSRGGPIAPFKGITFPSTSHRQEDLCDKDRAIIESTRNFEFLGYAISYVKDAVEMAKYRELLGPSAYLVAKLERGQAVDEATRIALCADELWLCRGDLGAELGIKAMAEKANQFSAQIRDFPAPAIMAGQVLEHMNVQPTPTRSEVCYLYDTLQKGYRGFVLSDETAIGRYPLDACRIAALFK